MDKFFHVYNRLIEGMERGKIVVDYSQGSHWTSVRTEDSLGLAKTFHEESIEGKDLDYIGMDLKDLGELSKSWNLKEASLGLAAINAYYNSKEKARELGLKEDKGSAFSYYKKDIEGKKVSVVGHFPYIERELEGICDLRILEREVKKGDYPDSACEVLIPQSDYVFITSCTLVNKTFPRLLELGKNSKIIMVGPSTPMAGILLEEGIFDLSGFIAEDLEECMDYTLKPRCKMLFESGMRVSLNKLNYKESLDEKQ